MTALSPSARVGAAIVAGFAWLVMVSTVLFVVLECAQAQRIQAARSPVIAATDSARAASEADLAFSVLLDTAGDGLQHEVVVWAAKSTQAPRPPGIQSWPLAGGVLLSPELRRAGDGLETRYGHTIGDIGPSGLIFADERLAYVLLPVGSDLPGGEPVTGFGEATGGLRGAFGEGNRILGPTAFYWLLAAFLVAPTLALVLVAGRVGIEPITHRDIVLRSLGADPRVRRRIRVLGTAPGLAVGAVTASLLVSAAVTQTWRVPWTGWLIDPTRVSDRLWLLLATGWLSLLLPLAWFARASIVYTGPRPRARHRRIPVEAVLVAPLALLITTRGPDLIDPTRGELWRWIYRLGSLSLLVAIPVSIAAAMAALTTFMRQGGSPSQILAGAWLDAHRTSVITAASMVTVVAFSVLQVQGWSSTTTAEVTAAATAQDTFHNRIATLTVHDPTTAQFLLQNRPELRAIQWRLPGTIDPTTPTDIGGDCADLATLDLPCTGNLTPDLMTPKVSLLASWLNPTQRLRINPPGLTASRPGETLTYLLVADHTIDLPSVKATAWQVLPPDFDIDYLGNGWLTGATSLANQARWIPLFGGWALTVALIGLATDTAGAALRRRRQLAPVAATAGTTRTSLGVALWGTGLPLLSASVIAFIAAGLATAPLFDQVRGQIEPTRWPTLGLGLTGLATLTATLTVYLSARRAIHTWHPGRDR